MDRQTELLTRQILENPAMPTDNTMPTDNSDTPHSVKLDLSPLSAGDVSIERLGEHRASITLEPLERGFGHTLGNALRRVLLSSIQGAAITEATITGALHEYSTLQGVREDVIDILMNLKQVALSMPGREEVELELKVKGPGEVRASDIRLSHDVELANPDHIIAHLDAAVELQAVLVARRGRGYVPGDQAWLAVEGVDEEALIERREASPIGRLSLDASFSPVRRVAYTVQGARVEGHTDFDKLQIELETDGTVTPDEALRQAAHTLYAQFEPLLGSDYRRDGSFDDIDPNLLRPVTELDLSARTCGFLREVGVTRIGDLVSRSERVLLKTPNIGKKSLEEIKAALALEGYMLEQPVQWPPPVPQH